MTAYAFEKAGMIRRFLFAASSFGARNISFAIA
jgi:hypothetical protein